MFLLTLQVDSLNQSGQTRLPCGVCVCVYSVMSDSATPWPVALQAPLSMGFSRKEYWSGLPFSSPGDLSEPGIEPASSSWQADSLSLSHLRSLNMKYTLKQRLYYNDIWNTG